MKIKLLLLVVFVGQIFCSNNIIINEKINEVVVYNGYALIKKEAKIKLSKGEQKVLITNLPVSLIEESCQINLNSKGSKILDVTFEDKVITESENDLIKLYEKKIDSLYIEIKKIGAYKSVIEKKENFLKSVNLSSDENIQSGLLSNKNVHKNLENIMNFLGKNHNELSLEKLELNINKEKYTGQINDLNNKINKIRSKPVKKYKELSILVSSKSNDKINIDLSYLIRGAFWEPSYDIYLSEDNNNVSFDFFAKVQQSSGENWNNVNLKLSNLDPLKSNQNDNLSRWNIGFQNYLRPMLKQKISRKTVQHKISYFSAYHFKSGTGGIEGFVLDESTGEPLIGANVMLAENIGAATDVDGKFVIKNIPAGNYKLRASYIGYRMSSTYISIKDRKMASCIIPIEEDVFKSEEIVISAKPDARPKKQKLNSEVVTEYISPNKISINSDSKFHKTLIQSFNLSSKTSYKTVPKINQKAYVNAKVFNGKDTIIKGGEAKLFIGNNFIKRTNISDVLMKDTLIVNFGESKEIKINRKLVDKKKSTSGLFSKSTKIVYKYLITIENLGSIKKTLNVIDQIPYSDNEEIKIELLTKDLPLNKLNNKIDWNITLDQKEKKELKIEFSVEYPSEKNVYGLE